MTTGHCNVISALSHFFCDFSAGPVHLLCQKSIDYLPTPLQHISSHTARLLSSCLSRQTCHRTLTVLNLNIVLMSTDGLDELLMLFGEQDGFVTVY